MDSSEGKRKRKRVDEEEGEEEDLISRLPSELSISIFGLLPTLAGVYAAAMCRRWRSIWRLAPLDLDDSQIRGSAVRRFSILQNVQQSHQGLVRRLSLRGVLLADPYVSTYNRWFRITAFDHLDELAIVFEDGTGRQVLVLPSMLRFTLVRVLLLANCRMEHGAEIRSNRLSTFELRRVNVSAEVLQHLLNTCPSITDLRLVENTGYATLNLSHSALRRLFVYLDPHGRRHLEELTELTVSQSRSLELICMNQFANGPSVTIVDASSLHSLGYFGLETPRLRIESSVFLQSSVCSTTSASMFSSIRILALKLMSPDINYAVDFLLCAPNLEILHLLFVSREFGGRYPWDRSIGEPSAKDPHGYIQCLDRSLRAVTMWNCSTVYPPTELANFFISRASILEMITFATRNRLHVDTWAGDMHIGNSASPFPKLRFGLITETQIYSQMDQLDPFALNCEVYHTIQSEPSGVTLEEIDDDDDDDDGDEGNSDDNSDQSSDESEQQPENHGGEKDTQNCAEQKPKASDTRLKCASSSTIQDGINSLIAYLPMEVSKVAEWEQSACDKMIDTVDRWTCLNFSRMHTAEVERFCLDLILMCNASGTSVNPHPFIQIKSASVKNIENALVDVHRRASRVHLKPGNGNRLQLLIVILPEVRESYGNIKGLCEAHIGTVSHYCLPNHALRPSKQFLKSIALNISVKVRKCNTFLEQAVGADVTSTPPAEDSASSIAAGMASLDLPELTKYKGLVSAKPHRQEIIEYLFATSKDPWKGHYANCGMIWKTNPRSERIIYRNGLSEGQFSHDLLHEMDAIRKVTHALAHAGLQSSNLIVGIDFTKSNEWTGKISDNKPCDGFEEALDRYREIVPQLYLSGPTSFTPIIVSAIGIVDSSCGQYHVLLIIADGQVTHSVDTVHGQLSPQERATIDAIVKASDYPLSIMPVGVGNGPWNMIMNDNIPARAFYNFQFVNFSRKEADFDLSALMEIPAQFKAAMNLQLLGKRSGFSSRLVLLTPMSDKQQYSGCLAVKQGKQKYSAVKETQSTSYGSAPKSASAPRQESDVGDQQTCFDCGKDLKVCPQCQREISTRTRFY